MQTQFACSLPSCSCPHLSAPPVGAPQCATCTEQGRPAPSPFRRVRATPPLRKRGMGGAQKVRTPIRPHPPLSRTGKRAQDPPPPPLDRAPVYAQTGASSAPQRPTETPAHGVTPAPPLLPLPCLREKGAEKRRPHSGMHREGRANGSSTRTREDGSGQHRRRGMPPHPYVCGGATQMGSAREYPPFSPAPIACSGAAHNPRATREPGGGGAEGKQTPPASRVSTTPCRPSRKTPVCPTFRVPRARRPACGTACARWHAKGGACRGLARGTNAGSCSHPPPSCDRFPTWSRATGTAGRQ